MTKTDHHKMNQFSVAPMMEWTDRHCRFFHRVLTKRSLLFTEMVTSAAVVHGDIERLLGYDDAEHPVAVQLGGSNPDELARATKICADFAYDEINLNVGCPSDRVQSGSFGACLMAEPALVADCVRAMKSVTDLPISVKCRIGIDDQDSEQALDQFADAIVAAGVDVIYVHARKAWLQGLSPKENRDVPPLDYPRVYRLAKRLAPLPVIINGGIETLEACETHLGETSGVMLGRAAYKHPMLLTKVDRTVFGEDSPPIELADIIDAMTAYAERECTRGVRLNQITRHMLGIANAMPGARQFRRILTVDSCMAGAGPEVITRAFAALIAAKEKSRDLLAV